MKNFLIFCIVFLSTKSSFCQSFDIKNNIVFIDGKECLKISSSDPNNVAILDADGNEIIFLKFIHDSKYGSLYNKIIFLDQKVSFTSKTYIYTKKNLIKRLLAEKVIENCKLNSEKIEKFILKFDEDVEK
jgi:hypothetical protein